MPEIDHARRRPSRLAGLATRALNEGEHDEETTPAIPLKDTPSSELEILAPLETLRAEPSAIRLDRGVDDEVVTSPPPPSRSAAMSRGAPRSRQPKTILTVSLPAGNAEALRTAAQHERLAFADIVMDAYNGHADALARARWRRPEAGRTKLNLAILLSDAEELNRLADQHGRPLSTVIAALLELHLGTNQH